jgi:tetratricopeptide (TPR) repeat protein
MGYPTVVIFDSRGAELTRIPGGMNIEQYVGVLELALNALRPVGELLQAVQAGEDIRDDDWRLLASYSWGQDRGAALGDGDSYTALRDLAAACPERLAASKSKLQTLAILSWAGETRRDESLAAAYASQIARILNDPILSRDNLSLFTAGGADMVKAMDAGAQRTAVREAIAAQLAAAAQDPSLSVLARIDAVYGWVEVQRTSLGENEPLPVAQQDWVKAQVAVIRPKVDRYQQHAALSTLSDLYLNAGLEAEARAAMQEGMKVSKQPYYFMSGMAYLEQQAGNSDAAIAWYEKAWNAAKGPATRVQWGSSYLLALIEFRPDDTEAIETASVAVMEELAQQNEGLYQRNSARMDKLSRDLLAWAETPEADPPARERRRLLLDKLRGEMDQLCAGFGVGGDVPATCGSFLVPQE